MIFKCPSCQQELTLTTLKNSYQCINNHSFDIAKEGYINLLLAHHKRSKNPGDDNTMMACRQAFLNQGYYQFLVDELVHIIAKTTVNNAPIQTLLDIGCGEGFYGHQIKHVMPAIELAGIDIAKGGVRLAAKRKNNQTQAYTKLAVASAYDLPVMDNCFDCAMSVFSPIDTKEAARVLKSGGLFIAVGPANNHLQGLAEAIYDSFKPHENGFKSLDNDSHFKQVNHKILAQEITLQGEAIYHLLTMTPYYWSASAEKQEAIKKRAELTTPLAFEITCYQRSNR